MEVYDAVAKAALVQQLELGIDTGGQGALRKSWHSSTNPSAIAWPASSAPPIAMSDREFSFSRLIAAVSNSRSIRVLSLDTV
jgi:hypothetical protein